MIKVVLLLCITTTVFCSEKSETVTPAKNRLPINQETITRIRASSLPVTKTPCNSPVLTSESSLHTQIAALKALVQAKNDVIHRQTITIACLRRELNTQKKSWETVCSNKKEVIATPPNTRTRSQSLFATAGEKIVKP